MTLPRRRAPRGAVELLPLDDAGYAEFAARQVLEYADQLVRAGEVGAADGARIARERLADLLADRLRAAGHEFLRAVSPAGVPLGWIWTSPPPPFLDADAARTRWLSQLTIDESLRGRGWGRAVLAAVEARLAAAGVEALWLRVFDWNLPARALYAACGYEPAARFAVDAHLRKRLAPPG